MFPHGQTGTHGAGFHGRNREVQGLSGFFGGESFDVTEHQLKSAKGSGAPDVLARGSVQYSNPNLRCCVDSSISSTSVTERSSISSRMCAHPAASSGWDHPSISK